MSAPLQVLHFYAGNLYGGIERHLVGLAGHGVPELSHRFGLCWDGRLAEELRAAGARVDLLGAVRLSRPWTLWSVRRAARSLLGQARPDAVICHACWPMAVFGAVVSAEGLPLLFWQHDPARPSVEQSWIDWWAALTTPVGVVCNSRYIAGTLRNLYPDVPSRVIYCAVARPSQQLETHRSRLREELSTPANAVVILQASRLEAWKGHRLQLLALSRLVHRPELPAWVAWFAGGPQKPGEAQYLAELQSLAGRLGVATRVRWLGQRADVPALLAAADVFCQPNTGPEPFGVALVEALYAGRPVVSTDLGGATEIVTPRCGRLTPADDPDALAETLVELIRSPALRAALGNAGPARAAELCDPIARQRELADWLNQTIRGVGPAARGTGEVRP